MASTFEHDKSLFPNHVSISGLTALCLGVSLTLVLAFAANPSMANPSNGHFTLPLPSPDLPQGTLTVKVVGQNLRDLKVDLPVILLQVDQGKTHQLRVSPTGKDGRARFSGLLSKHTYAVRVEASKKEYVSQAFEMPEQGGVRLLLTLQNTQATAKMRQGAAPMASLPPGHPPLNTSAPMKQTALGTGQLQEDDSLAGRELRVVVLKGVGREPVSNITVQLLSAEKTDAEHPPNAMKRKKRTDLQGQAIFKREFDKASPWRVEVMYDGLTYTSEKFDFLADRGLQVTLNVYDRSKDKKMLRLAEGSHWVCQIGEQVVRFMQVLVLENRGTTIFDPGAKGLSLDLPEGVVNVEIPQDYRDLLRYDKERNKLLVMAKIPPGQGTFRFFFSIPYQRANLEFKQRMALFTAQSKVAVLGGAHFRALIGPSIKGQMQREPKGQDGVIFLVEAVKAGGSIEFTILGLPERRSRDIWMGIVIALLIALWGVGAAFQGPRHAKQQQELRDKLMQGQKDLEHRSGKPTQELDMLRAELEHLNQDAW